MNSNKRTRFLHPRDEILEAIGRIYGYRMTTTSGGNLSIREPNGDIWITPARVDKGGLRREVFGPVAPVVEFDGLDQAIEFANDSDYGLTSSIYTRDLNVALRACQEIRFGETYINRENFEAMQGFHAGWRKSGIGGADGKHGLYEFTQTHVVYLQRY